MSLTPGTRLGPYEIVAPIGSGGMGEVYKARDTRLERIVAIKVLNSQITAGTDARERFEREARVISQLSHPHICPLFDVGDEHGTAFLVMEYLEGETLADRLQKTPLTLTETLRFGIEIASALDAAHRQGVVHRDLKPGNVMITKAGAKLLDFGLAKIGAVAGVVSGVSMMPTTPPNLTAQGTIVGTFQYMSPEQLEGKDADARTDIFAFGAVLFEMATGRKAFQGATQVSLIGAILKDTPVPVSSIIATTPPALDFVIRKCMAKLADDRWQTSRDLVSQLEWIAQGGSQAGAAAVPSASVTRPSRIGERIAWAAAIVFAGAALTLGWLHYGRTAAPPPVTRFQFAPPADTPFVGTAGPFQAVSPDGRRIAFIVNKGSDSVLAVRSLDAIPMQILPGTEDALFPFWSPDSRFIGFFAGGKLKKIDASGGPPQVLCNAASGEGGTWNSAGTILFAPANNTGLFRVPAAGGEPTPVTTLDAASNETSHRWPWFLLDGRHFVYLAGPPGTIYAGALDAKDRVKLVSSESKAIYADGHLLFIRQGTLLAQPFDATGQKITGDAFPVAESVANNTGNGRAAFGASANGVLAFRTGTATFVTAQLTLFDRGGKPLRDIGPPASYAGLDATPDGAHVAVHNHVDPGGGDVWVIDAERGTNLRFTFDVNRHFVQPIWSHDGSRIAFGVQNGKKGLLQKASSGAGQDEQLVETTAAGNIYPTDWSRDGRFILYQQLDPATRSDIWAFPLFGDRKPYPVLKTTFNETLAALSPDGRWIAYQSDESGRFEIYVQPFPLTGGKWQISAGGGGQVRWRQDGQELFYLGPDRKLMAVGVRADGGNFRPGVPKALFDTRASLSGGTGTVWYPYAVLNNGQRFLVSTATKEAEATPMTVVVNWTAALRK
jgi:Tol biopolymer transport system component/predicted Ser/Thr protein kinase